MNNQLKLPWIQSYRETPSISHPAFVAAVLAAVRKAAGHLRREGHMVPQPELGNGYAAFAARRHQLR
jgi:hypothetical protein